MGPSQPRLLNCPLIRSFWMANWWRCCQAASAAFRPCKTRESSAAKRSWFISCSICCIWMATTAGRLPLEHAQGALKGLLAEAHSPVIQYSDHIDENGAAFLQESCRTGLEGIISKRRDRPYVSGRSGDWVKIKCFGREELGHRRLYAFDGGSTRHRSALGWLFRKRRADLCRPRWHGVQLADVA